MRTRRGLCYPEVHASTTTTMTLSLQKKQMKVKKMMKKNRGFVNGGDKDDDKMRSFSSPENDFVFTNFEKEKVDFRCRKRAKISPEFAGGGSDFFDSLPDDLVVCILAKLSSTASCPADFINVLITYVFLNFTFSLLFFRRRFVILN